MNKIVLPQAFIANMKAILGDEYPQFESSIYEVSPVSIRLNSGIKLPNPESELTSSDTQLSILNSQFSINWCRSGRYLSTRPSFTFDPLFHSGSYYVQEAASMFVEQCVNTVRQYGNIDCILDLCAAPGGKSTHLISLFPDSLVVCNELIRSRTAILEENISKWGRANTVITSCDPAAFRKLGHFFDFILVDAPCSGEGMFRKDHEALKEWSSEHVKHCASRQSRIVRDVWDALKPGGFMLYGTCTYNIEENENIVKYIIENLGAESIPVDTDAYEGISKSQNNDIYACRFFPHKTKSEGLFLALLRKTSSHRGGGKYGMEMQKAEKKERKFGNGKYFSNRLHEKIGKELFGDSPPLLCERAGGKVIMLPERFISDIEFIGKTVYTLSSGTEVCTIKGTDFVPSHSFALSADINAGNFNVWEVDRITALKYLKRETLPAPSNIGKGYVLLTYLGVPLGWVKNIGVRCNNMLPQNRRIKS
jgi:16S rRNA C967 or C1407 C5-methylase (RsmB/RsmF family)/NOL1/NOP2/fmu family ribosome biogenesis protein